MSLSQRVQELMNRGIEASKEILNKAGAQAQTWGEMGVLKVEIVQLRNQMTKHSAKLGALVYEALVEKSETSITLDYPPIKDTLLRMAEIEKRVAEREERFRTLGGAESDLDKEDPAS